MVNSGSTYIWRQKSSLHGNPVHLKEGAGGRHSHNKYTGESKRSPYVQQADPIKVTW